MKNLIAVFLLLFTIGAIAQTTDADNIVGNYNTEGNKGKVTISKKGTKYFGTLTWTNVPDAYDKHNPDESKRKNKLVGTVILKDFVYSGDKTWEKGTVYDPESGKTYSGKLTLNKDGSLNMRGFVGVAALGRTTKWTRAK